MRTKFPTAFIIVRSWLKYVFNCVGIIIFVLFQIEWSLSLTFSFISLHSFSFWVSLNSFIWDDGFSTFRLPWWSHYTLTYLSYILSFPFLVLSLYILFIISFTFSLFTYNLFNTHIFADSSPSLQLMRVESAYSCPLYLHGVVCEFLPRFTGVIVACILFYSRYVYPNMYPVCHSPDYRNFLVHTYLSFILHIL